MNRCHDLHKFLYPAFLMSALFISSCDDSKNRDDITKQPIDTISVKKLTTDSNSDMPTALPKDSTVRIPNPFDSSNNRDRF
jgi:hypothetical protein